MSYAAYRECCTSGKGIDMFLMILRAKNEDERAIFELQKSIYEQDEDKFGISPLKQTLAEIHVDFQKCTVLKAIENDKIIGSVRAYLSNGSLHIEKLFVVPEKKGFGIEDELLRKIEKCFNVQRYEVAVIKRDKADLKVYQQAGYKIYSAKDILDDVMMIYLEKRSM